MAALVGAIRMEPGRRDELVELLPEQHPVYSGRSANAAVRIRGYLVASFERVGLPPSALPYVLDELQNGRDAYLVAASAMALRGFDGLGEEVVGYLLQAIGNVTHVDDTVSFDAIRPRWPARSSTTAMVEILRTLAELGERARPAVPFLEALAADNRALSSEARTVLQQVLDRLAAVPPCCRGTDHDDGATTTFVALGTRPEPCPGPAPARELPTGVVLEDQHGRVVALDGYLTGKPSVVAFFYTRCENPNKCSLTIAKLAELQRTVRHHGLEDRVRIAAISYDPEFDRPERLLAYGLNRGMEFSGDDRFLRATSGFDRVRTYFELGVNYGPTVVNRHRIELFVLDRKGRIARTFVRLQWDPEEVLREAVALAGR